MQDSKDFRENSSKRLINPSIHIHRGRELLITLLYSTLNSLLISSDYFPDHRREGHEGGEKEHWSYFCFAHFWSD